MTWTINGQPNALVMLGRFSSTCLPQGARRLAQPAFCRGYPIPRQAIERAESSFEEDPRASISFIDIRDNQRRWIIGEPRALRCCGKPRVTDFSYGTEHLAVAYQQAYSVCREHFMPSPKGHAEVVRSLESVGRRSFSKAVNAGLENYHKTPSGRVVVLVFTRGGGEPLKRIYLDQIAETFSIVAPPNSVFDVAPLHRPSKTGRLVAFKSASGKRSARRPIVIAGKSMARSSGGRIAAGKASSKVPAPIREFAMLFLVNLRRLICPTGKKKLGLAATTNGIVGGVGIWIGKEFGITNEVALSCASAVLITIATATKGAFCDMTDEMVKAELKKA